MNKGLEKEIDYLRDTKTHLWIAGLSSFGGSFTFLALNIPMFFKILALAIGITLSIVFFDNYLKKGDKIEKMIKLLRKIGG